MGQPPENFTVTCARVELKLFVFVMMKLQE